MTDPNTRCECGHEIGNHPGVYSHDVSRSTYCCLTGCPCPAFKPVEDIVTKAWKRVGKHLKAAMPPLAQEAEPVSITIPTVNTGHIVQRTGLRGGKPVLKGTRITIEEILNHLALGWSIHELKALFPGLDIRRTKALLHNLAKTYGQPAPQQVELEEILTRYHASFSCDNIDCATKQHRQCTIDAKAALIAWARKGR